MSHQAPLRIEDLRVLQAAEELADTVWAVVQKWRAFERDTVGKQLVRSADSIGANIAEAFGRFHYGEKLPFLYYARGSVFETKYWLNRSHQRRLMSQDEFETLRAQIKDIVRQLNAFANLIKRHRHGREGSRTRRADTQTVQEPQAEYLVHDSEALFSPAELEYLIPDP